MHKNKLALIAIAILAIVIASLGYSLLKQPHVEIGEGPLQLEVLSDKPTYLQGETATFYVYVINPQNWSIRQPTTLFISIVENLSQVVNINYGWNDPTIPPNSKKLFYTQTWDTATGGENQTRVQPGNYTFTAKLWDPHDSEVNCTVSITDKP